MRSLTCPTLSKSCRRGQTRGLIDGLYFPYSVSMVDLVRLFEFIELSMERIEDEFGEWSVTLEALWESGNKYYAVFHATWDSKSTYFGYEFWSWEQRVATAEDVEADLAGLLTWHFMAGDYPTLMSNSEEDVIDWRTRTSSDLPRTLSELNRIRVLRKR